jgi:hypothetical protein
MYYSDGSYEAPPAVSVITNDTFITIVIIENIIKQNRSKITAISFQSASYTVLDSGASSSSDSNLSLIGVTLLLRSDFEEHVHIAAKYVIPIIPDGDFLLGPSL